MGRNTVKVEGIPTNLPPERVKDKLTIHFLRSRNGGGEIEDIDVNPGPPPYALITFEDAKVAQRVLSVKDHVCAVNGNTYRLRVTSHSDVINPNEIFVNVSMTVDCRKFPEGFKNATRALQKLHKGVEFRFDQKEEFCNLEGTYTKLLALSNDILKTFGLGGANTKTSHSSVQNTGQSDTFKARNALDLKRDIPEAKSAHHSRKSGSGSERQSIKTVSRSQKQSLGSTNDIKTLDTFPVDEDTIDHLEDFSLVMDSDIYMYIHRFKKAEYQNILSLHNVEVVDVNNDDITTLYLQAGSQMTGDVGPLTQAHFELLNLYANLQMSLRKEQISKTDIHCDRHALKALPNDLQIMCPLLLCHEDEKNIYFIGDIVDVTHAKKYIQELQSPTKCNYPFTSPEPLLSNSPVGRQRIHPGALLESKTYSSPKQNSSMQFESKGEQRLAANFSIPKSQIYPKKNYLVAEDDKLSEPKSPFDVGLTESGFQRYPSLTDQPTSLSNLFSTTNTEGRSSAWPAVSDGDVHLKSSRDGDRAKGITFPKRVDSLPPVGRDKESNILHDNRVPENIGPLKVSPYSTASNSLAGLSLFDTTHTSTVVDHKPSQPKSTFMRSNSFSAPRSKAANTSDRQSNTKDADFKESKKENNYYAMDTEICVDNCLWAYVKDVYCSYIAEVCSEGPVQIGETRLKDITVLKLCAVDKTKLDLAKECIESLYHQESTNLTYRFFNYHQLGVESSDDEALDEWCHVFQNCSDKVRVRKDKNKLHLTYPKEVQMKISEEYNTFFEKKMKLQSLPSVLMVTDNLSKEGPSKMDNVKERNVALNTIYDCKYDSQKSPILHVNNSEILSHVLDSKQSNEREMMEELHSNVQGRHPNSVQNNSPMLVTGRPENLNDQTESQAQTKNAPKNLATDGSTCSQQAEPPHQENSFSEQERSTHASNLPDHQRLDNYSADAEVLKVKRALPDKFLLLKNNTRGGSKDDCESHPQPLDIAPQSLPVGLYGTQQNYSPLKTVNERAALMSIPNPGGQTEHEEHSNLNRNYGASTEGPTAQPQSWSPSVDQEAQEDRSKKCDQCKKANASLMKNRCGHCLCRNCCSSSETCHVCLSFSSTDSESVIKGRMSCTTMALSLPGYNQNTSFKIVYDIPDGTQGPRDPNPGKPYKGGRFEAYLPDNKEGKRILNLLKKAFDEGRTFKIHSFDSEDKVTWSSIRHKTSIDGGKSKNGYPDSQYLKTVFRQLKDSGIE